MARNEEKAQSLLARYLRQKKEEINGPESKRPFLATHCSSLKEAEKWRREIISEISKKVSSIQNAGLGEFRIRDLNDEINKLLREKRHWQERIKDLGGPDYFRVGPKMLDQEGREVPGQHGYRYFGAAKDLPGVRELFEEQPVMTPRRTRGDLFKHVDADYYGYRDEDDGILVALEAEQEDAAIDQAVAEWEKKLASGALEERPRAPGEEAEEGEEEEDPALDLIAQLRKQEKEHGMDIEAAPGAEEDAHADLAIPSQVEIEKLLLERRKQMLLEQYASEGLREEEERTKTLTGRG